MAQSGEASAEPANARVARVQTWLAYLAGTCMTLGVASLQVPTKFPNDVSLWTTMWRVFFIGLGLSALLWGAGRGVLLYLRPNDARGQLPYFRRQFGMPRLYGLALIWAGLVLGLASVGAAVLSDKPGAIIGFGTFVWVMLASVVPGDLLILCLWIRRPLNQWTLREACPT